MVSEQLSELLSAAFRRECSKVNTMRTLVPAFPESSFVRLSSTADALYEARVEFLEALDAMPAEIPAASRNIKFHCARCGDPFCSRAELVREIRLP